MCVEVEVEVERAEASRRGVVETGEGEVEVVEKKSAEGAECRGLCLWRVACGGVCVWRVYSVCA